MGAGGAGSDCKFLLIAPPVPTGVYYSTVNLHPFTVEQ